MNSRQQTESDRVEDGEAMKSQAQAASVSSPPISEAEAVRPSPPRDEAEAEAAAVSSPPRAEAEYSSPQPPAGTEALSQDHRDSHVHLHRLEVETCPPPTAEPAAEESQAPAASSESSDRCPGMLMPAHEPAAARRTASSAMSGGQGGHDCERQPQQPRSASQGPSQGPPGVCTEPENNIANQEASNNQTNAVQSPDLLPAESAQEQTSGSASTPASDAAELSDGGSSKKSEPEGRTVTAAEAATLSIKESLKATMGHPDSGRPGILELPSARHWC